MEIKKVLFFYILFIGSYTFASTYKASIECQNKDPKFENRIELSGTLTLSKGESKDETISYELKESSFLHYLDRTQNTPLDLTHGKVSTRKNRTEVQLSVLLSGIPLKINLNITAGESDGQGTLIITTGPPIEMVCSRLSMGNTKFNWNRFVNGPWFGD